MINAHSVNHTEVNKFTEIDWWDPNGPMQPLHQLNPIRLAYVEQFTSLNAVDIADIGCGGGLLAEVMSLAGAAVTGIDANASAIAIAKEHAELSGLTIDYIHTSIEDYAKQQRTFNVITCMELLEHVDDPAAFIQQLAALLKPGGQLFLATLNRNLKSYLGAVIAAEYILQLLPRGTHDYNKLIKPSELAAYCRSAGLQLQNLQGMQFNPLTGQVKLSQKVDINYLAYFVRSF
ncbi:MAG: bifunctional 3-demethylubiquinol 3-O-methyltransferase/2-polyprenyl-6-hydroxyphenol methylase [Gammaproteobacteria bacterium RIFCSPHIGHO2_12_FULL_41_15]|nr:MAG: bifunctional 3-demethylubiquinol 3-O-methyltransferase/2-polyprenyl-6-hydroxyphenol methylase [Gammaproteobacteria bacterium RIFCSPHIGHO2_12_FULL_41_15]